MKKLRGIGAAALALASLSSSACEGGSEDPVSEPQGAPFSVRVEVDPRVELLAALFRAGGRDEYNLTQVPSWADAVDEYVGSYPDHPAVTMSARLAGQYGVGFFVPMSLAVHVTDPPELEPRLPFADARSLHRTWTTFPDTTALYLDELRDFARVTGFDAFMAEHQPLIDSTTVRLGRRVSRSLDPEWFARFWGTDVTADFVLVPGLTNGRASYGVDFHDAAGRRTIYAVTGVADVDTTGLPVFDEDYGATVVHEFNHAFVDDLVEAKSAEFTEFGEALFDTHAEAMRAQRYGSWESMVREYLVRAAVARYRLDREGPEAAAAEFTEQQELGWVQIRPLAELLAAPGGHEATCAAPACAMDEVVAFFRRIADGGAGTGEA